MKCSRATRAALVSVMMTAAGWVHAGPPVDVTFKNLSSTQAVLTVVTSNESSTYQIASPKPSDKVASQGATLFRVQRVISPDVNAAMVRYSIGSKTCAFGTTYQMRTLPGGIKQPLWTKTATPSGGANCTAMITRTNGDYSWAVEFTMR
ncbi:hypothetical protein DZC75_17485 [Pseudomonas parafulva]|uniref:Lipoprotein n=2 Tax=Pseudomonas parafulva TaxID=157782 RepID=A0AAI8KDC6_9PSED|nr:hypothetical protein DZC75_17485 [Pseudomonas parafulva]